MQSAVPVPEYTAAWPSPVILGIVMAKNVVDLSLPSSHYESTASLVLAAAILQLAKCSWYSEHALYQQSTCVNAMAG